MSTRTNICCLALFTALAAPASLGATTAAQDIRVLRSDGRSVVLEYRPQYLPQRTVSSGGREYVLFDFEGSIPLQNSENVGSPDLRYRQLPLGFPSATGNTVQVIAADYEDMPNISYAPIPSLHVRDGMLEAYAYEMRSDRYRDGQFIPSPTSRLMAIGRSRNLLVGGVQVFPIQYNPATRTVRKYTRLTIEIIYGSPATQLGQDGDDALFKNTLLNYDAARSWKAVRTGLAKTAAVSSVLASGDWYRLTISDDGIYRLDASYLAAAGVNISSIDPRTIKIYGNGGTEVPEDIPQPRPADLVENAIYVEGEGDAQFNQGDFVLFYGKSPRGWRYDSTARKLRHYLNHYTEVNYYWLTVGGARGKRMVLQPSLNVAGAFTPPRFIDGVAVEEEKVNFLSSGKDWYGQSIGPGSSFTHVNALPGLNSNDAVTYRYNLVSSAASTGSFTVRENGRVIGVHAMPGIGGDADLYAAAEEFEVNSTSTIPNNTSQLNFAFSAPSLSANGWIDWVEILYPRSFSAVGNYLHFRSPDTAAVVEYTLQQFTAAPFIFNVTTPSDVRLLSDVRGAYTFQATERAGNVSEYFAAATGAWKIPTAVQKITNQDLHGFSAGAEFIIITTPEFRSSAERLKAYREQPAHGNLRTIITDVNQIYNEFGGGLPDISAIRDYLYYDFQTWTRRPQFVLLFGQGSYDYKGILGARSSYVPTWQSLESRHDVNSYSTDDFFAEFGYTNALSLVLGRISSRSPAEADLVVDKLMRYEDSPARDNWKMRILYVGDDAWTSELGDTPGDGTLHSDQAELLAETFTPEEFEKKKIYIAEYPTVWTAQGRRKPGAYQAIIDQINQGVLIFNYTGHGNPTLLAHESIFVVQTSIPQLTNSNRLSVFFLATCNFSQFDDPKRYTGSEILMNKPDGGAVGVVSATRKVYASDNATLNQQTYRYMFTRDAFGRVSVDRPATALFSFKTVGGNSTNDQKYFYMGDPTMRLQYPQGYASIDSVNHQPMDSVSGLARRNPVQVKSLSRVTVSGTIRDQNNLPDASFNGTVTLAMNDATRQQVIINFYPGVNWSYESTGGTIYRGDNSVRAGKFTASFILPKDVAFADSLSRGRLVAYYSNGSFDGAGYTGNIHVGGADTITNTGKGPSISIYLGSRGFRPGDVVTEQPVLYVDLADSNGINTSGSGIGHRIEAWLNNASQSKDVTDFYSSKLDNFREGTVQYQLTDLPSGQNTIRIRAWDSYNNSAVAETFFRVASSQQLSIMDVLNYPNPFADGTSFTFRQNQSDPLDVEVKIYTLAGRAIKTIQAVTSGESFVRIPWDGRDRDGDILANGVYFYKLIVKTVDGRFSSEALGKLSVLR